MVGTQEDADPAQSTFRVCPGLAWSSRLVSRFRTQTPTAPQSPSAPCTEGARRAAMAADLDCGEFAGW